MTKYIVMGKNGFSKFEILAEEIRMNGTVVEFRGHSGQSSHPDITLAAFNLEPGDYVAPEGTLNLGPRINGGIF